MHRNQSVSTHAFSMVPRADIPRSSFKIEKSHKTTFDSGLLIPFYVDEVLPGDTHNLSATMFVRMATPIFPVMDNIYIDTQWFFVPCRLVWDNFQKFMGEQVNPGDSTDYLIPQIDTPAGGAGRGTIYDYMGIPTSGQVPPGGVVSFNALPLRAYALIYNEWYRDQNLIDSVYCPKGDGPDTYTEHGLRKRGKRHDYFTSCLPWTQKGDPVQLPLGSTAPVYAGAANPDPSGANAALVMVDTATWLAPGSLQALTLDSSGLVKNGSATGLANGSLFLAPQNLHADLSEATAATINQIRMAFQIQRLLERDARGGTRYTEWVRSHFGVLSPDARLQRPEYLGGNSQAINISPVAQTGGTGTADTPQGNLAAFSATVARNGFTYSATEHGYIIGLCSVRADLTYQQGLRRMWSRRTKYDIYVPVFAMLGEQAVTNKEIYCVGSLAQDEAVFGYQERWAEYRYNPSMITGLFRSTDATPIDNWHVAQHFTSLPTLSEDFINENVPMERILAVGAEADGQQFIADIFTRNICSRCMPMYSVPGMVDHF